MIQEIVYTSSRRGLKKGSRGFCTVISTAGMGTNMAERLESMSGYRHAFPLNDPNVGLNPVNYAHVTTRLAGQKLHVISRVANAGQDYSGRTNKLAHHIVIDNPAALPAGPARVLADPSTVISDWDESVTTRPPRTISNPAIPDTVRLSAWNAVAGDNGWAGFVAEQLLASRAPVNVIFTPGTDTLALVQEVLDLVPIPQRWSITFSTYFTRLLAGTECQLRFILGGTTEATSVRNDARAVTVDLTARLAAASGGALVDAARSGTLDFKQAEQRSDEKRPVPARTEQPVVSDEELAGLLDDDVSVGVDSDEDSPTPITKAPRTSRDVDRVVPPRISRLDSVLQTKEQKSGMWITATVALLLIGGIGVGVYLTVPEILRSWRQRQAQIDQIARSADADAHADETSEESPEVSEPSKVLPFDGRSPFGLWTAEEPIKELPPLADSSNTEMLQILTNSPGQIDLKLSSDDLILEKSSGDSGAQWTAVNKTTISPVAVFEVASQADRDSQTLYCHWNRTATVNDVAFRRDAYLLQNATLQITAPTNSSTPGVETFDLTLKIPALFGGKGPLDDFAQSDGEGLFQWNADAEESDEIVIYTHSPQSVSFAADDDSLSILESGDEWQVKSGGTSIGRFIAIDDSKNGLRLRWRWDGIPDADTRFWKQKYLLREARFTLSANREDGADEHREVALRFAAPDIFEGTESTGRLLLPNPLNETVLSETSALTMNLWNDEVVALSLHPDFNKLISTPGRTLQLTGTEDNATWTATIIDGSTNDQPDDDAADQQQKITLAEYSLVPVPDVGGRFRLAFRWLPDARREIAGAELVRWCPLIVEVGPEQRVFIQREADPWLIPPWDRQKGFVLEQEHTLDKNRTGAEFADLNLQTGDDAFFELTYIVPTEEGSKQLTFSEKLLLPVTEKTGGNTPREIHHTVWFPLDSLSDMQEEDAPDRAEICVLDTVIRLPENRSEHAHFQLETKDYVRLDVPRFDSPEPGDLPDSLKAADENRMEADGALKSRWRKGDVTPQGDLGIVRSTQVRKQFEKQRKLLDKEVRENQRWIDEEINVTDRHLKELRNSPGPEAATERNRLEEKRLDLAKWSESASDLKKKYAPDRGSTEQSPYVLAEQRWQGLMKSLGQVRMRLTLGIELGGKHPTRIVFVDAKMETPDDN